MPTVVRAAGIPLADGPLGNGPPEPADFWSILWFGAGWFGFAIMILLALCSVATLALIIEDFLSIRRGTLMPEGLAEEVHARLSQGELVNAEQRCKDEPSTLSTVLLAGLHEARHGYAAVEKAMETAAQDQNARLHRKIDYLSLASSIGPMLGLLGTVWGMVVAFQRVAETQGRADPGELAGGIYQALYTTVIGLVIAIPGLICYGILRNRVDNLTSDAAQLAERAVAPLKRLRLHRKRERAATPPLSPPWQGGEEGVAEE
jgi:biopolymer transport protein ExbB